MSRRGVSYQTLKAPIRIIGAKVKKIKVKTMVITTERVIMSEINYNHDNNFNRGNYGKRNERVGPMFHLKIVKFLLGMVEVVWHELRICCRI